MNINPTFILSFTQAERGTEFEPGWGSPSDCLTARYLQAERPALDKMMPISDQRFARPGRHEESASWTSADSRLVWRGSRLYHVTDRHTTLLSHGGEKLEPKWDPLHKTLYYLSNGCLMGANTRLAAGVEGFDLTHDGQGLIFCQKDHVQRLNLEDGTVRSLCHTNEILRQVRLSPNDQHLAAVDSSSQIKIVDLQTGLSTRVSQPDVEAQLERESWLSFSDPVRSTPTFSPDGKRVLYARTHTEETDTGVREFGSIFAALPPWAEGDHRPCRILGGRDYDGVLLLHNLHAPHGGHNEARV